MMQKIVLDRLKENAEKTFVIESASNTSFTCKDILEKAFAISNYLFSQGIRKGSKVAIILNNSIETITIYFANLFMGAASIPLNPNYNPHDFEFIINKCRPDIILTTGATINLLKDSDTAKRFKMIDVYGMQFDKIHSPELQFELPEVEWENPIAILFTSGTTGRPKGVVMKYGAVLDNLKQYGADMKYDVNTRFMQVVPLFHAHGWLYSTIVPALFKASLVLNQPFNASLCSKFWDITRSSQANALVSVPSMLVSLLEMRERYDILPEKLLKYVICGSAFLHAEVKKEFENSFKTTIYEFYGSTETIYIGYHSPSTQFKPGTVGHLFPDNCRVKIAEDNEILVKTKYIFKEYLDEPELTQEVFEDDWYKTGDLGSIDADGYISLFGRKKDIINKGGYKVAPKEITDSLMKHEAVRDAATIGVPDQMYGEEIYSFVVTDPKFDINEQAILKYCKNTLNPMICPKRIIFIEEIPKNAAGKVDKFNLVEVIHKLHSVEFGD